MHGIAERLFTAMSNRAPDLRTQLVEVSGYHVSSCNGCQYECLLGHAAGYQCPVQDDVPDLWRQAAESDLLVYFLPTYGGMPPATWVAFQQRYHGVFRKLSRNSAGTIAAVTLHDPLGTRSGDVSQSVIVHHLAGQPRKLLSYEPIIAANYGLNALQDRLIDHPEIQARVDGLGVRMAQLL